MPIGMLYSLRHTLPLWWCLTEDMRKALTPLLSDEWEAPKCEWTKWMPREHTIYPSLREIERFMRERPKPVRVT